MSDKFDAALEILLDWTNEILHIEEEYQRSVHEVVQQVQEQMRKSPARAEAVTNEMMDKLRALDEARKEKRQTAENTHNNRLREMRQQN